MKRLEILKDKELPVYGLAERINPFIDYFLDVTYIEGEIALIEDEPNGTTKSQILQEKKYKFKGQTFKIRANINSMMEFEIYQ
jgi:hypothetical protein